MPSVPRRIKNVGAGLSEQMLMAFLNGDLEDQISPILKKLRKRPSSPTSRSLESAFLKSFLKRRDPNADVFR